MTLRNAFADIATEPTLASILTALNALNTEVLQKLEAGEAVALPPATLAALESITAVVSGEVSLDAATLAALESISVVNFPVSQAVTGPLTDLQLRATPVPVTATISDGAGPVTVDGTVALDAPTLAALESITVAIAAGQTVALDASTLAALETITAVVSGSVSLDAGSLSALESVSIDNFPASQAVTGPVTNTELRAAPLPFASPAVLVTSGSVAVATNDAALITPAAGKAVRYLKFHLHMDPAAAQGSYNTVTVKIGAAVVFTDRFEPGLPYLEAIVLASPAVNAAVTITTSTADTIFYNLRHQES